MVDFTWPNIILISTLVFISISVIVITAAIVDALTVLNMHIHPSLGSIKLNVIEHDSTCNSYTKYTYMKNKTIIFVCTSCHVIM